MISCEVNQAGGGGGGRKHSDDNVPYDKSGYFVSGYSRKPPYRPRLLVIDMAILNQFDCLLYFSGPYPSFV